MEADGVENIYQTENHGLLPFLYFGCIVTLQIDKRKLFSRETICTAGLHSVRSFPPKIQSRGKLSGVDSPDHRLHDVVGQCGVVWRGIQAPARSRTSGLVVGQFSASY